MVVPIDLFRLFAGVTILAFASYTDWQWRRAPNALWTLMGIAGILALAGEIALDPAARLADWPHLAFIPIFAVLIYVLWYFGLIAGGADAKALMALGLLLPYPVHLGETAPYLEPAIPGWPGAASVLANSLLLFLAIPLSFMLWNLAHGHLRFPHLLLGIKRPAKNVRQGHVWPMESLEEDGTRRTRLFPSRMSQEDLDTMFDRLQTLGTQKVWVTPKVPFMIPLLLGFITTFFLGDLMLWIVAGLAR